MKTIATVTLTIVSLIALTAVTALVARADEPTAATKPKTFTGTITTMDAKERTLTAKRFLFQKSFHLGDRCVVTTGAEKETTSIAELHPGEKIEVTYVDASGVRVASRVKRLPLVRVGRLEEINAEKRALTLREGTKPVSFAVAEDCRITLAGGKDGKLDALLPGTKVTVFYELPPEGPIARRIEQTCETFTGSLTAVDTQTRTLKAKQLVGGKTFQLARDCRIVLNGKSDAQLSELRLGQKLTFSFEEVDGVNVANCVTSAEPSPPASSTASTK